MFLHFIFIFVLLVPKEAIWRRPTDRSVSKILRFCYEFDVLPLF